MLANSEKRDLHELQREQREQREALDGLLRESGVAAAGQAAADTARV